MSDPQPSPDEVVTAIRSQVTTGLTTLRQQAQTEQAVLFMLGALAGLAGNALYANDYFFGILFTGGLVLGFLLWVFLKHRTDKHIIGIMSVFGIVGVIFLGLVVAFAQYRQSRLLPQELHGLRIPGNEPAWNNRCTTPERSPYDWMQLDIGSNMAMTFRELAVIKVNGQELISIAKSPAGIAVSARIISTDGTLVGQVSNNELWLNPGNRFRVVPRDWHILEIRDNNDAEILFVHYLNRANVIVRGRFYGSPPVVVNRDRITIGGITMMLGCYRQDGSILEIGS